MGNFREILCVGRFFRCDAHTGLDVVREAHSPGASPRAILVRALRARFVINLPFLFKHNFAESTEGRPQRGQT